MHVFLTQGTGSVPTNTLWYYCDTFYFDLSDSDELVHNNFNSEYLLLGIVGRKSIEYNLIKMGLCS